MASETYFVPGRLRPSERDEQTPRTLEDRPGHRERDPGDDAHRDPQRSADPPWCLRRWSAYGYPVMAIDISRVVWREALEIHLRAVRMHEEAARRFLRVGDIASATLAAEFGAAERQAHAEALARHPDWAP